jgi:hypothetical protein
MSHLSRPPRGQQRDKPYREALRMELAAAGDNMKKLREIARAHIARCEAGDMQAIRGQRARQHPDQKDLARNRACNRDLGVVCFACAFRRRRQCSMQMTLGERNQRYSPRQGAVVNCARSSSGNVQPRRSRSAFPSAMTHTPRVPTIYK